MSEVNKEKNPTAIKSLQNASQNISSALLLPAAVIFLAVAVSASMIISASIIGRNIKESGLAVKSDTTSSTVPTTTTTTTSTPAPSATVLTNDQVKGIFQDSSVIKFGDDSKKVLFVEFSDPSCPFCHIAAGKNPEINKDFAASGFSQLLLTSQGGTYIAPIPEMKKLVDEGKASYAWVYYPGHGNGQIATQAFYCANQVGKFWDVHDKLMSKDGYYLLNGVDFANKATGQDSVKNDKSKTGLLAEFLKDAMNKDQLKSCLDSGKYEGKITSDPQIATRLGLTKNQGWGTPGLVANTKYYEGGAVSFADIQKDIANLIQ